MLDRLAGVVSETLITTKNISTLIIARLPIKILGFFFLATLAILAQTALTHTQSKSDLVEATIENLPHLYATLAPLETKITKVKETVTKKIVGPPPSQNVNLSSEPALELDPGILKIKSGQYRYSRKLRVFATSYDPNCPGCNSTTALGMKAGYGVIAVDPKVIPLGSNVYVPGYGSAIAGDTGSAIKGNVVDLGFNNVKNGWWSSRYTDIYILE